jgi:hypothetical protein
MAFFVIIVSEFVDLMPSEDGQLTETCKGNKYLQIESHWAVLTIILQCNITQLQMMIKLNFSG